MASIKVNPNATAADIEPSDIYGAEGPIGLRIATGGAGQSGLLRALANAFIEYQVSQNSCPPFKVAWLATDTSLTFNALASGAADVGITYHAYAEKVAMRQELPIEWSTHGEIIGFWSVGPKSNPAKLPTDGKTSIYELFALLFQAAVETSNSPEPVKFLSRYDKSANNITESHIWTAIGQTPWAYPYSSSWYHVYHDFPYGALRAASKLGEYTLVDRGAWFAIEKSTTENMVAFAQNFDGKEGDPLMNPAHALVGKCARNKDLANAFVDWLHHPNRGQRVIESFAVNGTILFSKAPPGVDPMERIRSLV